MRPRSSWLHDRVLAGLPTPLGRTGYHHTVEDALEAASPTTPAVLLPSPDFDQVRSLVESGGLLPEKATSFQPKPSLGVHHAADERRMILAAVASTSTRERVAPPAW